MRYGLRAATSRWAAAALLLISLPSISLTAYANHGAPPYSAAHPGILSAQTIPRVAVGAIDPAALLGADAQKFAAAGDSAEKRLRVAVPSTVDAGTDRDGIWQTLPDGSRLWLLQVHADGATDLRLGFARFDVPAGVTLHLVDPSTQRYEGPYGADDATPDHQLWLAPFAGSDAVVEVQVPPGVALAANAIRLTRVGSGYRNTTESGGPGLFGAGVSGLCNVDVVCPLGTDYPLEIKAVAKYYFDEPDGTYLCSGTLMNDTTQDFTPYFLTANHCISTQAAATSMSLIWNYESPTCGAHGGGSTADTQNGGATLLAHRADVDFSLVRLNSTPASAYAVAYAGWDASGGVPAGSIGIHHPSGWVKAITQNTHALTTINSCIGSGSSTHWKTGPYAQGTTEGGSSGSALLIPAGDASGLGGRVIGTLSGGGAACSGSVPNASSDCYGKLSVAFDGASPSQRLRDWLAPTSDFIFQNGFEITSGLEAPTATTVPTVTRPAAQ